MGRARGLKASKATVVAETPAALANATSLENIIPEGNKLMPKVPSLGHFFGENFPGAAAVAPKRHPSGERRAAEQVPTWDDGQRPDDIVDVLTGACKHTITDSIWTKSSMATSLVCCVVFCYWRNCCMQDAC
jgi:hypothetical protein